MGTSILKKINTVVTHTGNFHADDVFTVAYIYWACKQLKVRMPSILRISQDENTLMYSLEKGYLVIDVGGGQYDHHKKPEDKEKRTNGIEYASFGLVVREFHDGLLTDMEYQMLEDELIQRIDYHDNHGKNAQENSLSNAIAALNFRWDDPLKSNKAKGDERFLEAVEVAEKILTGMIENIKANIEASKIALKQYLTYNTVFMTERVPVAQFYTSNPQIKFVGCPCKNGYEVSAIRDTQGNFKALFPEDIRGTFHKADYEKLGIVMCITKGSKAIFKSMDAAKRYIIENT